MVNDAALWRIAGKTLSATEQTQMNNLLEKKQAERLNQTEQQLLDTLLEAYQHVMLLRAEAAVLLKGRGYNVSDPTVFRNGY